ncbi:LysR family transcriptional regulator [Mesorhizobium sp. ZC-5]|uniref:LysR family transcriptional regulator n=1 Tax=Mesorhizobium sp. ZC-5 TaxID=2986066 RepID=UPI0021E7071D|nr:LysR family transcriptional regulator [Mesorhizobium sp. ZC-5]MCV3243285.1 LysR family transcriptional regulator [Mesorhizobium sp. ZC-5]
MHAVVLRYIDQVARLGSIRRAAGVLNVASSAVNRQILKLEAEIGTSLFERVGNGVRPTAAGEYVIRHARETIARWNNVRSEISTLSGDIHGEVRIVSIPAPMVRILPRAIEETSRHHPHIAFRVIDAAPKEHSEEMRARRPDIAILFIDRRHRGYEVAARIRMRIGAIMRPGHALAGKKEVTLTECAAYPVCMLSDPWILNATAEAEFTHSGAQFRSVLLTNSLPMTKEVMLAGLGIGFFTPTGFVDELKAGELIHVPLAEPDLSASEIGLLIHRDRQSSPAVSALAKRLVDKFAELERDISAL